MLGWLRLARICASREKPGEAIRVRREGAREDLQRDLAVELGVGRLPDLSHPALAEKGGDVVVVEVGAGGQGHAGLEPGPLYGEGRRL